VRQLGLLGMTALMLFLACSSVAAAEVHDAAKNGNLEQVKQLLTNTPGLISAVDESGRTPLHWACRGVHFELVKYLVENGADINAVDKNGIAPLHSVASRGHAEAARCLIEKGADLNMRSRVDLGAPLHYAAQAGHESVVRLLLERGARTDVRNGNDETPLHAAAKAGQLAVAQLLAVKMRVIDPQSLNLGDFDGNTALHLACCSRKLETASLLLTEGADINARNTVGQTTFNMVSDSGFSDMRDFLVEKSADQSSQKFPVLTGPYLGQTPPGATPQLFSKGVVSTLLGFHGTVVFSPEMDEVVWDPDCLPTMLYMRKEKGVWTAPRVFPFQPRYDLDAPCYSPDGTKLLFMAGPQDANGMVNDEKIWYVERRADGWSEPKLFDSLVNSVSMHFQFSMDNQGNIYTGGKDIYCSHFENGHYSSPAKLPSVINTDDLEGGPFISPDGDYLIFNRVSQGTWSFHFLISFRTSEGDWTEPRDLSEKLQGEGMIAKLSPDGKYLFFQSNRPGSAPSRSVYWVDAKVIDDLRPGATGSR
jgi:ankyrin repeat protein